MTDAVIKKITGLWTTWRTDEKLAQLGRLVGQFSDHELLPVIDAMAEDPEVKYFDARVLARRIKESKAKVRAEAQDSMTARQFHADVHRRQWIAWSASHPPKDEGAAWPDYATMDDNGILALVEQAYRKSAKKTYGYVPGHYDWYRQCHVERDPPFTEEERPKVPVPSDYVSPWAEFKQSIEA